MTYPGKWHGLHRYFGLHYDLHANEKDTDLGARCSPRRLIPLLKLMNPDFVQTDCKGHPGHTSWFSKVPAATVSPGVIKDALKQWRAATRALGLPLHCHYSGIWDAAAAKKHPQWAVQPAPDPAKPPLPSEKMCPRSPYLDELLIPQFMELIEDYGVDGFWVDGDMWGVEPCYCERCRVAFRQRTGIAEPPVKPDEPDWPAWWNFTRESFEEYVTRYCDAVHRCNSRVLVCSNWLQTFTHPGEPTVPTDWISGDNTPVWGLDNCRCEARFISTRGKPWDIMLWGFYSSQGFSKPESPWVAKSPDMLTQEAALVLAFGGNLQVYEHPAGLRDGRLVPWRQRLFGRVGRFVKQRRALCQGTETIPQVAILHSEYHLRSRPTGTNLMWHTDVAAVKGAVFGICENQYGVDVLDEWALMRRLAEFPVVVAPEQERMSQTMLMALKDYVERGGRLLLTGAGAHERFGAAFLGATAEKTEVQKSYHVPTAGGAVPIHSAKWLLLEPTHARGIGQIGCTPLTDDRLLPHPAATLNRVGRGLVGYVPADLFRDFNHNRYPMTRAFIGDIMNAVAGPQRIRVKAPHAVEVVLRRRGQQILVHLINRLSGIPQGPANGAVDEIPEVGPIEVSIRLDGRPRGVRLAFEPVTIRRAYRPMRTGGILTVRIPSIRIHACLLVDCREA